MKKILYILLIVLLVVVDIAAQEPAPGGVQAPAAWLRIGKGNGVTLYDYVGAKSILTQQKSVNINGNAAVALNSADTIPSLPVGEDGQLTFAAVYSLRDTTEQPLFSVQSGNGTPLLATPLRLADLEQRTYLNYPQAKQYGIYLYTLQHAHDSVRVGKMLLNIARNPQEQLPVKQFKGAMPEAILYHRILTLSERRRVQSYLSIKYGVSLEQQSFANSYYSSLDNEIWNANRLSAYSSRITGVGRDDNSGLLQESSTNAVAHGLPLLAVRGGQQLPNQSFLLWGDNGKPLRMCRAQGMPLCLERRWLTQSTGAATEVATDMYFSTLHFENLLARDQYYWLAVDHSATGKFPVGEATFQKSTTYKKQVAAFDKLTWSEPNAVFTVVQAPEFFVHATSNPTLCEDGNGGSITLRCVGGTAPYRVALNSYGRAVRSVVLGDSLHVFKHLEAGRYELNAVDAYGRRYADTLHLWHTNAAAIQLSSQYMMHNGVAELNANLPLAGSGYYCVWEYRGNTVGNGSVQSATQPGLYTLTVRDASGCISVAHTTVEEEQNSQIKSVLLYPNPSPDGHFYLRIKLAQAAAVAVRMYNMQGGLLQEQIMNEATDFHVYEGCQPHAGIYLVTIQVAGEKQSFKLIVGS